MFAQSMRTTAAAMACAAALSAAPTEQSGPDVYRGVVEEYRKTGDAAKAVEPLRGWSADEIERGVQALIARADTPELEAAATLHLEIGIAVAGLAPNSALSYFDHAERLIGATLPPPDIRRGLSAERLAEITDTTATILRVAASTFLSINDVRRARPLIARARRVAPDSAPIVTLAGTADEIDSSANDPDVWDGVAQRTRAARERSRFLTMAEGLYKDALKIDEAYPLARIRLGRVQFLLNNTREARKSLEAGRDAAKEPRHKFLAALFLGALLERQKDLDGARQSYETAHAIIPQSQNAVVALSNVELLAGNFDRAHQVAREFASAKLDDAWWAYKTGVLDLEGLQALRQRMQR